MGTLLCKDGNSSLTLFFYPEYAENAEYAEFAGYAK